MKEILVVRFSSLGDIVLLTGVLKYVKENVSEDIAIDLLTYSHFAGVLQDYPYIRNIYTIKKGDSLVDLNETMSTMPNYDIVFDLHNNIRSRFVRLISSCKSYVYNKHSLARRLYVKYRLCRSKLQEHTVIKYFKPFMKAFKLDMPDIEMLRPYLPFPNINRNSSFKNAVIHPFASKATKEWPFFAELGSLLSDDGLNVTYIGNGVMNVPASADDKTGKVSLSALIEFIAQADIFITTDSGPMHIATALNVPTIAIFGPTTKELGFYPTFKNTKVIEYACLKCRPCHIHGSSYCYKKHFKCMLDIGVEEVRYHVNAVLSSKS